MTLPLDDIALLRHALSLAETHMQAGHGGPFGALIARDGVIISEGWNQVTSTNDPTAHAEVVAIRNACAALGRFHLQGYTLYTSCEPCPMCLSAAYWAHVDAIIFAATREDAANAGFDDAWLYDELATSLTARRIPTRQLLGAEARAAFAAWNAKPDKIEY